MNKAILIGNLGKNPEISHTESGTTIAKFSIATTEKWTDKSSKERQSRTEWHRITVFGKLAEICGEYRNITYVLLIVSGQEVPYYRYAPS